MAADARSKKDSVWFFIRQQSPVSIDKLYGKVSRRTSMVGRTLTNIIAGAEHFLHDER